MLEKEFYHIDNFARTNSFIDISGIRIRFFVPKRSVYSTRADRRDTNIVWDQFLSQSVCKTIHSVFGSTVSGLTKDPTDTGYGRYIENATTFPLNHVRHSQPSTEKCTLKIDVKDSVHDLYVLIGKFNILNDTSVVDEHVDPTMIAYNLIDRSF